MTPPPQHTSPLQVSLLLLLPLQKFSSYYFLHFPFVFIRVHSFSIRVHPCSFVFHSCSFVFIRVPFVFHSCSLVFTRVHSCSTRVHSYSLVFTRVHSCSFVFRSVWCFRYDRLHSLFHILSIKTNYHDRAAISQHVNSFRNTWKFKILYSPFGKTARHILRGLVQVLPEKYSVILRIQ